MSLLTFLHIFLLFLLFFSIWTKNIRELNSLASLFEQISHLHIELPEPEQTLNCFHEETNTFDRFAIKVCEKDKNEIVGHLPMEISRVTKFLLDRGANVSAKLTSTHYRRSLLVQGGIEIPCVVSVYAWYCN